jgi:RNA polymerase sigma factor (TIGR02999 family)
VSADDSPRPPDAPPDDGDFERLIEEAYAELRRIAERYVRRERANSVQATELVHEAYIRLRQGDPSAWRNRTHFLAIAAISMRRLLVERGRARAAAKRGGGRLQITLDDTLLAGGAAAAAAVDVVDLDDALSRLAALDSRQARIVELRYFGGLTVDEVAAALGISPATVKRDWTVARAWLLRELGGSRR